MTRPLRHELLERRDLLTALRLVSWNTMNGPNDAPGDDLYRTIFEAIGQESVAGNVAPIGVLALQETDVPGSGGNSIGRIESILDGLYPSTDYASAVSSLDGGGDATGFVYDTSMVDLLATVDLSSASLTHSILRGLFRPDGTSGDADFYVYTVHLKAGTTGADADEREFEAGLLRDNADALGEGASVLFVGDFNLQGSSEGAWSELLAIGNAQLFDLADAPGEWNDNPAFLGLHTQNPGGPMDDRFDFQFATGELSDGQGIDYVEDSYRVFGNNGTHTLNGAITTGVGASIDVLAALAAASDHLPVVVDYQVVSSGPAVLIAETGGQTAVAENGAGDSYTVTLSETPMAPVTVTIMPDPAVNVGAGPGKPVDLVFTPENALTPQVVPVTARNDYFAGGVFTRTVTHTTASADLDFDGLSVSGVSVTIFDDDAPSVTISELMYNPLSDETLPGIAEWIEVVNTGGVGVDLSGWRFDDEDATDWGAAPLGTILSVGQAAVFFDAAFTDEATFRAEWAVPTSTLVVGVTWGSLANSPSDTNEVLELLDGQGSQQDLANFDDAFGWPGGVNGQSIYLTDLGADNNVGENWARSEAGVAGGASPSGPTFVAGDVGSPGRAPGLAVLPGDYNGDGTVDVADYTVWRDNLGGSSLPFNQSASLGVVDVEDWMAWRNTFGDVGASATLDAFQLAVEESPTAPLGLFAVHEARRPQAASTPQREVATGPTLPDLDLYFAVLGIDAESGSERLIAAEEWLDGSEAPASDGPQTLAVDFSERV